ALAVEGVDEELRARTQIAAARRRGDIGDDGPERGLIAHPVGRLADGHLQRQRLVRARLGRGVIGGRRAGGGRGGTRGGTARSGGRGRGGTRRGRTGRFGRGGGRHGLLAGGVATARDHHGEPEHQHECDGDDADGERATT